MNIIRFLSLLFIALLFQGGTVYSEIKKPVDPHTPSVDLKEKKREHSYPVLIDFPQNKKIRGSILFNIQRIRVLVSGGGGSRYISISEIKSVDFLQWRGKEYRENSYLFKPSKTKISLNDGSSLIISGNLPLFNRVRFLPRGKNAIKSIYPVFYDYYKNSKWINSGSRERDFPENNPHKDTLVRIVFLRARKNDLLTEEILKYLKK
jgi:hypothetical protein